MAEDFPTDRDNHPLDDEYWAAKRPILEDIEVPALVCASWSDQGLHTRGSLEGFERIGSRHKWLYTHGRRKWETFYSKEAREVQRRFFDRFLKGETNQWEETPRVRLEVRRTRDSYDVRSEPNWPLQNALYTTLFLDARSRMLTASPPTEEGTVHYDPNRQGSLGWVSFVHRFVRYTEITGGMTLKLWVSASNGEDLDLFVLLRKFDADGLETFFYGYNGFAKDRVAKGWLRVSHGSSILSAAVRAGPGTRIVNDCRCARAKSRPSRLRSCRRARFSRPPRHSGSTSSVTQMLPAIQRSSTGGTSTAVATPCTQAELIHRRC